jgi:dynein light intermediate chain
MNTVSTAGKMSTIPAKSIDGMMKEYACMNCLWEQGTCCMLSNPDEKNFGKELIPEIEANNIFISDSEKIGNDLVQYGPIHFIEEPPPPAKQKKRKSKGIQVKSNIEAYHFPKCGPSPELTVEGVIAKICPPRQWRSRGQLLRQNVSGKIPTRKDVLTLKEKAEVEFRSYKDIITEDGLCQVRRKLNGKILDEVIRQVSVQCMERGHLLIQIRDEYYHQFDSYERVFYSLIAFAIRKILTAKNNSSVLRGKIQAVTEEIYELERINAEFPQALEFYMNKFNEEQLEDDNIFDEEYNRLLHLNGQLKNLLLTNAVNIYQTKSEMI